MIIFFLDATEDERKESPALNRQSQAARNLMLKFVKAKAGDVIPLTKDENEALQQNHVMFVEELPRRIFFKVDDEIAKSLADKLYNASEKKSIGLTREEILAYEDKKRFFIEPYYKFQLREPIDY